MTSEKQALEYVKEMAKGATLLKAGRSGKPHFRQFQISADFQSITWESPKKSDALVRFTEIVEVVRGQTTKVFQQNPIPAHKELSFSLIYGKEKKSLDLVCKDRREFEVWFNGIEALRKGSVTQSQLEDLRKSSDGNEKDKLQVVFEDKFGFSKVVIREDASDVYTWGEGKYGKLGHGDDNDEYIPKVLEALLGRDVIQVACNAFHTIALTDTSEVYSWGMGAGGRLGNGKERNRFSPLAIAGLRGAYVTQIACGEAHSAAISGSGTLYTWGKGEYGELGYEAAKQLTPCQVDSEPWEGKPIAQVACGKFYTLVLVEDGRVFSFGNNDSGQLGHNTKQNQITPKCIEEFLALGISIQKVACGNEHAAAVSDKGLLYTWGSNQRGQLGQGVGTEQTEFLKPKLVENLPKEEILDVACGGYHTAVITGNGNLYCFGDGSQGQLGFGTAFKICSVPKPVSIPENKKITAVSCGEYHTAILNESGQVYTFGAAGNGRLGHDDTKERLGPTLIESMEGKQTRMVICGATHTIALVTHGWVPDKEAKDCMACKKKFTQVRRRHHCRKCGGIFCGNCSSKKFPLLEAGFVEPVRVCDKCFAILSTK